MEIAEMLISMMLDGWQLYLFHNGRRFYVRAEYSSGKEWLSSKEIFYDVVHDLYKRSFIAGMIKK